MRIESIRPILAIAVCAFLAAFAVPTFAACPSFSPAVTYPVGGQPDTIAIGDFNGDGIPDLVMGTDTVDGVSVLLGKGNGIFGPPVDSPKGIVSHHVAVGDFNGDGKLDLAVATQSGGLYAQNGSVWLELGNGDGTFAAPIYTDFGARTIFRIAAGDFNGDGKLDLAVTSASGVPEVSKVSILLGNGDGTLAAAGNYVVDTQVGFIAIGDFNGDGNLDLAVASETPNGGAISILLGNGDGTFAGGIRYNIWRPEWIAIGDFNNDGKADLAVANYSSNVVSVLLGNGDGTFAPAAVYIVSEYPTSIAVGDFNGDTKADLVVVGHPGGYWSTTFTDVSILLGNGDGTFASPVKAGSGNYNSVVVGDFNDDGHPDIVVGNLWDTMTNNWAKSVAVLLNTCSPPDLTITKTHTGNFVAGQSGATYTLTVSNVGPASRSGPVAVSDTMPNGLTATAMAGTGWSCDLDTLTCARTDELSAGSAYPPISVTVNVAANPPASVTNSATVTGDHFVSTASDWTAIAPIADLTIAKSHTGIFHLGQTGAAYTLTVTNAGFGATIGDVTVTDTMPSGLTATAIAGTGWTCTLDTVSCTRSDVLAAGAHYSPITVSVNVAADASPSVTNVASVSGGGELYPANDTTTDLTGITPAADLTVSTTHAGSFAQGQWVTYTLTVHNIGLGPTVGAVSVAYALPEGVYAAAISGTGWTCLLGNPCSRTDVLASGNSYEPITLIAFLRYNAPASITNTTTVSGGDELNTANNSASDSMTIDRRTRADYNGDGIADVIWHNPATGENAMWVMNGCAISEPALLTTVDPSWKMAAVGDFDGDGKADVIWLNDATADVAIWLMNGTSLRSAAIVTTVASTDWKIAGAGDFNQDGKSDVVWRNQATGQVVIWLMDGTSITAAALVSTDSGLSWDLNWNIVAVGDFGSGSASLFWRNGSTGQNRVSRMNGTSILYTYTTLTVPDPNYKVAGTGDLDGDGAADVVWWNQATGDVSVWTQPYSPLGYVVGQYITAVSDTNWHPESVGDFDGDGKADIFWRNVVTGDTVIWLMDGGSIKEAEHVAQVNDLRWCATSPR